MALTFNQPHHTPATERTALVSEQWLPPSELWRHTWMLNKRANCGFLEVDRSTWPMNNSSALGTMKLDVAFLFWALAWSVEMHSAVQWGHSAFVLPNVSIHLKEKCQFLRHIIESPGQKYKMMPLEYTADHKQYYHMLVEFPTLGLFVVTPCTPFSWLVDTLTAQG